MKQLALILTCFLLFSALLLPAHASSTAEEYIGETLDQLGGTLESAIPEEAEDLLEELSLTELDWQQILSLTPEDFFRLLKKLLKELWNEPFRLLGQTLGILLMAGLLFPLQDSLFKEDSGWIFRFAALLCLCGLLADPVVSCIQQTMEAIQHAAVFLLALIPVLCAVLTVGGHAAAASGYQLLLFSVCQMVSQLAVSTMVPLLGIYFALGMMAGVFPGLGIQGIADGIKKLLCWGLGIVTTLFVGLLSLQTFISSNVDVVTLKASRFLMGNFIPVIGSILSEAFGAAQGCISLIKGTVGTFGILAAVCTMLPILLQVLLWYFVTWLSQQLSVMLQVKELGDILKAANNTFAILLALLLCFLLLIVVATTLVIYIGTGG